MNLRDLFVLIFAMAAFSSCDRGPARPEYPETKKADTVDVYYGTEVADPYRWLEDDQSEETKKWVQKQVEITNAYLGKIPFRERIEQRLTEVWNYERQSVPVRKGNYWFFSRNDGLQDQSVVFVKEERDGDERILLDPNQLSDDGTVALAAYEFSEDGKYMAYAISYGGSDWREIFVKDVTTGEDLDDHLEWVKFSEISWLGDKGFFYSRYDAPEKGSELTNVNEFQQVFFHKLGDAQAEDDLIYR
jgi:prolyl oligopeptidase